MSYKILRLFFVDKTLSIAIVNAPYESPSATTALKIIRSALNQGYSVDVFAYEAEEGHPTKKYPEMRDWPVTEDWRAVLFKLAQRKCLSLNWISCGLYANDRWAGGAHSGARNSSPEDCIRSVQGSDDVVVIPTR